MKLKILLLSCPVSHPRAIPLAKALCKRGHEVSVVTAERAPRFWPRTSERNSNPKVFYLPGLRNHTDYVGYLMRLPFYAGFSAAPFEIMHFFTPSQPYALVGAIISKTLSSATGSEVVIDWDEPWGGNGLGKEHGAIIGGAMSYLERATLRSVNYVTLGGRLLDQALTSFDGRELVKRVIHNGNTIASLPSKTEARRLLGIPDDRLVLIYQGNYTTPSYIRLLREGFERVSATHRRVTLVLLGGRNWNLSDFPMHLRDKIISRERVPVNQLEIFHAAADIALLPLERNVFDSYRYPLRVSDYLFAGLPIVATRVGESGMVIQENECGLLSEPDNASAFAENLEVLASDKNLRASLGENAKRAALANFTWDVGASRAEQLYLKALNGTMA